jgi:hypothetical protein
VTVVLLLAAAVVVAATVVLASGRGGELREPVLEHPPIGLPEGRLPTGAEAAMLQLPKGVWGYNQAVTDQVMERLVYALMRREEEVDELKRRIAGAAAYGPQGGRSSFALRKPDGGEEHGAPPYELDGSAGQGGEDRA